MESECAACGDFFPDNEIDNHKKAKHPGILYQIGCLELYVGRLDGLPTLNAEQAMKRNAAQTRLTQLRGIVEAQIEAMKS